MCLFAILIEFYWILVTSLKLLFAMNVQHDAIIHALLTSFLYSVLTTGQS